MRQNLLIYGIVSCLIFMSACDDPFEARNKWTGEQNGSVLQASSDSGRQIIFDMAEKTAGMYRVLDLKQTDREELNAYGAEAELWAVPTQEFSDERAFRPSDMRKVQRFMLFAATPQVRERLRKKVAGEKDAYAKMELYGHRMQARQPEEVSSPPVPELFYVIDFKTTW